MSPWLYKPVGQLSLDAEAKAQRATMLRECGNGDQVAFTCDAGCWGQDAQSNHKIVRPM